MTLENLISLEFQPFLWEGESAQLMLVRLVS